MSYNLLRGQALDNYILHYHIIAILNIGMSMWMRVCVYFIHLYYILLPCSRFWVHAFKEPVFVFEA